MVWHTWWGKAWQHSIIKLIVLGFSILFCSDNFARPGSAIVNGEHRQEQRLQSWQGDRKAAGREHPWLSNRRSPGRISPPASSGPLEQHVFDWIGAVGRRFVAILPKGPDAIGLSVKRLDYRQLRFLDLPARRSAS